MSLSLTFKRSFYYPNLLFLTLFYKKYQAAEKIVLYFNFLIEIK